MPPILPPWVQEGGLKEWAPAFERSATRRPGKAGNGLHADRQWKNFFGCAGSPTNISFLVGFKSAKLKPLHRQGHSRRSQH